MTLARLGCGRILAGPLATQRRPGTRQARTDKVELSAVLVQRQRRQQDWTSRRSVGDETAVYRTSTAGRPQDEAAKSAGARRGQQQVSMAARVEGNPDRQSQHVREGLGQANRSREAQQHLIAPSVVEPRDTSCPRAAAPAKHATTDLPSGMQRLPG